MTTEKDPRVGDAAQPEVLFARRDASFISSPGFARRYHAQSMPGRWFAACRDGDETSRSCMMLDDSAVATADRVSELLICKRPACYSKWRAALDRAVTELVPVQRAEERLETRWTDVP